MTYKQPVILDDDIEDAIFQNGVDWGRFVARVQDPTEAEFARLALLKLIEYMDCPPVANGTLTAKVIRFELLEEE